MYNTDFYKLLNDSQNNSQNLARIVNILKPLIRKYSRIENEITGEFYYDKDLESTIIEYIIHSIKIKSLANKLAIDKEKKRKKF